MKGKEGGGPGLTNQLQDINYCGVGDPSTVCVWEGEGE